MACVLGLDGGGTKTDMAVVDSTGTAVSRRLTEGLDPTQGAGWETTLARIAADLGPVAAAMLGLPYHGEIAGITARQTDLALSLFGTHSTVVNDVAVAFEGALAGADGVLVLAGTGSMAWSRGPLGKYRVGGWGDIFGDEGSAFWIGRTALGRISQELDGRSATSGFADAVLAELGIGGGDLIRWTYGLENPRAGVAGLAVLVSDLAGKGSAEARAIMQAAGDHLAMHGLTAARLCGAPMPARWSFAGGVMNDHLVRDAVAQAMGSAPVPPVLPPVGGAVLLAARAAGWDIGPDFVTTLQASLADAETS